MDKIKLFENFQLASASRFIFRASPESVPTRDSSSAERTPERRETPPNTPEALKKLGEFLAKNQKNKPYLREKTDKNGNTTYEFKSKDGKSPSLGYLFGKEKRPMPILWICKKKDNENPVYYKLTLRNGQYYVADQYLAREYAKEHSRGKLDRVYIDDNDQILFYPPQISKEQPQATAPSEPTKAPEPTQEQTWQEQKQERTQQKKDPHGEENLKQWDNMPQSPEESFEALNTEKTTIDKSIQGNLQTMILWRQNHFEVDGLDALVDRLSKEPFTVKSYLGIAKLLVGKKEVTLKEMDSNFTDIRFANTGTRSFTCASALNYLGKEIASVEKKLANSPMGKKEQTALNTLHTALLSERGRVYSAIAELRAALKEISNLKYRPAEAPSKYVALMHTLPESIDKLDTNSRHFYPNSVDENIKKLLPGMFRENHLIMHQDLAKTFFRYKINEYKKMNSITGILLATTTIEELKNEGCLEQSFDPAYPSPNQKPVITLVKFPAKFEAKMQEISQKLDNNTLDLVAYASPEKRIQIVLAKIFDLKHLGSDLAAGKHGEKVEWADILEGNAYTYEGSKQNFDTFKILGKLRKSTAEGAAAARILQRIGQKTDPVERENILKEELNNLIFKGILQTYAQSNLTKTQIENIYEANRIKSFENSPLDEERIRFIKLGYAVDTGDRRQMTYEKEKGALKQKKAGELAKRITEKVKAELEKKEPRQKIDFAEFSRKLEEKISAGFMVPNPQNPSLGVGFNINLADGTNLFVGFGVDAKKATVGGGFGMSQELVSLDNFKLHVTIGTTVGAEMTWNTPIQNVDLHFGAGMILPGAIPYFHLGVSDNLEGRIDSAKMEKLKAQGLYEAYMLLIALPQGQKGALEFAENYLKTPIDPIVKKHPKLNEQRYKTAVNELLKKAIQKGMELLEKNPLLKAHIDHEIERAKTNYPGINSNQIAEIKSMLTWSRFRQISEWMQDEGRAELGAPPVAGFGVILVGGTIPVPYISIRTDGRIIVIPTKDVGKHYDEFCAEMTKNMAGLKVTVSKTIDLGKNNILDRDMEGRLKLDRRKEQQGTYSLESAGEVFDSTKKYNEQIKNTNIELVEQNNYRYRGLLEMRIQNPSQRVTIHIDSKMKENIRLIYEGTKVYLAFKSGTPLYITREEISYPFQKNGAFTHTEIHIKSNPMISNKSIREDANGFYLTRRTEIPGKEGHEENWTKRAYRAQKSQADYVGGKILEMGGYIEAIRDHKVDDREDRERYFYRQDRVDFSAYKSPLQNLRRQIEMQQATSAETLGDRQKLLQLVADIEKHPEYKNLSTDPYSAWKKEQQGVKYNPEELTKFIQEKAKSVLKRNLNSREMNFILMNLMHRGFINIQTLKPAERKQAFLKVLERFTKPMLTEIFRARMVELGMNPKNAHILTDILLQKILPDLSKLDQYLSSEGAVIRLGTLFASIVGTRNTDGRFVLGLRHSERFGQEDGIEPQAGEKDAAHILKLLQKVTLSLTNGSANEKLLGRLILETLSPADRFDAKADQDLNHLKSPLALKLAPFLGIAYGPKGLEVLAQIMALKNVQELRSLYDSNKEKAEIIGKFYDDILLAREMQLSGQKIWRIPMQIPGLTLEITLHTPEVAAGLYKRCGNLTFVANEEISAKLIIDRKLYAGGLTKANENFVRANLATQFKVWGIATVLSGGAEQKKPTEDKEGAGKTNAKSGEDAIKNQQNKQENVDRPGQRQEKNIPPQDNQTTPNRRTPSSPAA